MEQSDVRTFFILFLFIFYSFYFRMTFTQKEEEETIDLKIAKIMMETIKIQKKSKLKFIKEP